MAPDEPTIQILHVGSSTLRGVRNAMGTAPVRLGRGSDNDIVFDPHEDRLVSTTHLELRVGEGLSLVVEDLGSTNGTWLDGNRIEGTEVVAPGQRIELGQGGPRLLAWLGAPTDAGPADADVPAGDGVEAVEAAVGGAETARVLPADPPATMVFEAGAPSHEEDPAAGGWIPTRWSLVGRMAAEPDDAWMAAWNWLIHSYEEPMQRYVLGVLRRTRGHADPSEAHDVLQAFFTACLERGWLSRADPRRGRFRAYMKVLLRRFVQSHLRREGALKRRPGEGKELQGLPEGDGIVDSSAADAAESEAFDREWVGVAIARTLDRLREEQARYHAVVHDLVLTHGEGSPDMAARVGLQPKQLPVLRHRARARFAALFAEELAATVGNEDEFRAEWAALAPYLP